MAFAVSQTTGGGGLRWDPFIRHQHQHLRGAARPATGVETFTRSRIGPAMVSRYVSYAPPTNVGMTMVEGPWFLESFGGGWRFTPEERDWLADTSATWKYTFTTRPAWLRGMAEPIGRWLLGREIRARIAAFGRACRDPAIVRAAMRDQPLNGE